MNYETIPYTATSVSILSRVVFLYILHRNKSRNYFSLMFCLFNIVSACLWLKYSIYLGDQALIYRNSAEISLLFVAVCYIMRNRLCVLVVDEEEPKIQKPAVQEITTA